MWVVLCIRSDEEWTRLGDVTGIPELTAEDFTTVAGRRKHHDRLDALIGNWTAQYDQHEAAAMLQAQGIPAAPVLANWELVSNLHFHDRGFYQPVVHDEMGVFPYPGMPWKLEDKPGTIRSAAPLYGAQNGTILKDLLDVDQRELASLYNDGIDADVPPPTIPPPAPLAGP